MPTSARRYFSKTGTCRNIDERRNISCAGRLTGTSKKSSRSSKATSVPVTISRAVVDENTAPVVRKVFNLYDKGLGYKTIAMMLNSEGFRTNQGQLFRVMFISRMLRNRAYIGILDYNRYQGRGSWEPVEIPGFYPAIIDQELFRRVQQKK